MGKEKRMIKTKNEFNLYSRIMKEKSFFEKFDISIELTTKLAAEDAMINLEFNDRQMTKEEIKIEFYI